MASCMSLEELQTLAHDPGIDGEELAAAAQDPATGFEHYVKSCGGVLASQSPYGCAPEM